MIKTISTVLTLLLLLTVYYYLCYISFVKQYPSSEFPTLRVRWGTMMHHSSNDQGGYEHIYCYWPKGETQYPNKSGEYIIKRQDDGNCGGWYGQAIIPEGWWVSEKEKLWWSLEQKLGDDLSDTFQINLTNKV